MADRARSKSKVEPPRGSSASDRALHRAAKDGHWVKVGEAIGLVVGLDDYHVSIKDVTGAVHLIHKSSPVISIHPNYPGEGYPSDEIEHLRTEAESFRGWVERHIYHHQ